LPASDCLVLDCEGAERDIVPAVDADRVVVETHGWLGSGENVMLDVLSDAGYRVHDRRVDDPDVGTVVLSCLSETTDKTESEG